METSNLLDAEFKTLVIRLFSKLNEKLNSIRKGVKTTKQNQSELKDTPTKMKNNLQGNNSRVGEGENQINNLEHKEAKSNQNNKKKKNPKKGG